MAAPRGSEVWRDFVTDGIPSSGANQPKKADIRSWSAWLESLVTSGVLSSGPWFATRASMTLSYAANTIAVVYNDPTAANNGLYIKVGASGSGSWTQLTSLLPGYQFVTASPTGASTANAIVASTSPRLPAGDGVALVTLAIPTTNTASPVTVRFDGGAVLTVKTRTGENPDAGELQQNDVVAGFVSGATFRLISDLNSLRNFQSAKAWANNDEDVPVPANLGGDGLTTFSAKHWAAKSEEDADRSGVEADRSRDEANRSRDEAGRSEDAAGVAAGIVNDIASEKEVPIVGTVESLFLIDLPVGMTAIRTNGFSIMGDGGAWPLAVEVPHFAPEVVEPWQRLSNGGTRRWELRSADINVRMFGATGDGVTPDQAAVSTAWAYLRSFQFTKNGTLGYMRQRLTIPAGLYLVTDTIDFTNLLAWNISIMAHGAVIIGAVNGKPVIDATSTRGVRCEGLTIYGDETAMPNVGLLVGSSLTQTCGNNSFIGLKIDGFFSVASCLNMGSETTEWDFCYFINKATTAGSYAFAGDAFLALGVSSGITTTRSAGTWASLTSNTFRSCRFAHHGGQADVYLDGIFNWSFDGGCYFLTWGTANVVLRVRNATQRITALIIRGLFESTPPSIYGGLDDVIKIVCDDGVNTAIEGLTLDMGQPHAKRSIIRVETPSGIAMTTGVVKLRQADIKMSRPIFTLGASIPAFVTGGKLMIQGEINILRSDIINLDALEGFQGTLITTDYSQVLKPTSDKPFNYLVFDEVTGNGRRTVMGGVSNNHIGFIAGSTPKMQAAGSTNTDMEIAAAGNGEVHASSPVRMSLPSELPGYTLATLPSAASHTRRLIIVTNATGGVAICRSNGTNWIDLHTKAPVA